MRPTSRTGGTWTTRASFRTTIFYAGAVIGGCSRTCVALKAVNDKLALTVYDAVLLPALTEYGVPEQLNTDMGREWDVAVFVMLLLGV